MAIIYWIAFGFIAAIGLIAGSIANFIAPGSKGGIVGSIVLGIIGAVVGGYLGQRFFEMKMSFGVEVAGSGFLLVFFIGRLLLWKKIHRKNLSV